MRDDDPGKQQELNHIVKVDGEDENRSSSEQGVDDSRLDEQHMPYDDQSQHDTTLSEALSTEGTQTLATLAPPDPLLEEKEEEEQEWDSTDLEEALRSYFDECVARITAVNADMGFEIGATKDLQHAIDTLQSLGIQAPACSSGLSSFLPVPSSFSFHPPSSTFPSSADRAGSLELGSLGGSNDAQASLPSDRTRDSGSVHSLLPSSSTHSDSALSSSSANENAPGRDEIVPISLSTVSPCPTSEFVALERLLLSRVEDLRYEFPTVKFLRGKKSAAKKRSVLMLRKAFLGALRLIWEYQDKEGGYLLLLMIPRMVYQFRASPGERRDRLRLLSEGCFLEAVEVFFNSPSYAEWHASTAEARPVRQDLSINLKLKKMIKLARAGNVGKATRAWDQGAVADLSTETMEQLENKHELDPRFSEEDKSTPGMSPFSHLVHKVRENRVCPISNEPVSQDSLDALHNAMAEEWEWDDDIFVRVIKNLAKESSSGWDGWKFEHFQTIFMGWDQASAQGSRVGLRVLLDQLAKGWLPPVAQYFFLSAKVIPLAKEGGGVRPIAIGSCLRRLAAKLLLGHTKNLSDFFVPLQTGVATSNGIESLYHATNFAWEAGCHVATLDVSNAFNSFYRDVMLYKAFTHFPKLFPFIELCYGNRSTIAVDAEHPLSSERGTQQGDPLSPLLFCLAIQDSLKATSRLNPGVGVGAYMDDAVLVSNDYSAIVVAMRQLEERFGHLGLRVNVQKSRIYINPRFYDRTGFGAGTCVEYQSLPPDPADNWVPDEENPFPFSHFKGFKFVGGWVGDMEGQEAFLGDKVESLRPLVSGLQTMASGFEVNQTLMRGAQEAYAIYTKGVLPKLSFVTRLHRPEASLAPCERFSSISQGFAKVLAGMDPSEAWGELQKCITHLPVNAGGLGLTDIGKFRVAAHFASLTASQNLSRAILRPLGHGIGSRFPDNLAQLKASADFFTRTERLPVKKIQKALSDEIRQKQLEEARDLHEAVDRHNLRELVFFNAKQGLLSSWLYIQPWEERIEADSFTVGVRVWLNLPLEQVCRCGRRDAEVDLQHLLTCKHGRVVIAYHNAIYRTLARHLRQWCNLEVIEEPPVAALDDEDGAGRSRGRYDFSYWKRTASVPTELGRVDADLVISSPFSVLSSLHWAKRKEPAALCEKREYGKRLKYDRFDERFLPLAMTSLGYVGPTMFQFLGSVKEKTPGFVWNDFLVSLKVKVLDFIVLAVMERLAL